MMVIHDILGIMNPLETMLTERGQTSIPAKVRRHMHLTSGTRLRWEELSGNECRVIVQRPQAGPGARAMLGYAASFRKTRSTREWLRELREGEQP